MFKPPSPVTATAGSPGRQRTADGGRDPVSHRLEVRRHDQRARCEHREVRPGEVLVKAGVGRDDGRGRHPLSQRREQGAGARVPEHGVERRLDAIAALTRQLSISSAVQALAHRSGTSRDRASPITWDTSARSDSEAG